MHLVLLLIKLLVFFSDSFKYGYNMQVPSWISCYWPLTSQGYERVVLSAFYSMLFAEFSWTNFGISARLKWDLRRILKHERWAICKGEMGYDTKATPIIPACPPGKSVSPTYSPGIQGWDLSWLEMLEWLEEGQSLATNSSSQDKSQPCIPGEYVELVFLAGGAAGIFGVALVWITNWISKL